MSSTLIALDIDGTLAPTPEPIPLAVVDYLNRIQSDGFNVAFVTGRTFTFANAMLKLMKEPFYLVVQNGAAIIELPSKKVVYQKYLSKDILDELDLIFDGKKNDYLIECGVEKNDECFFRSTRHTEEQLEYIHFRGQLSKEPWIDTPSFQMTGIDYFPLIKCFGEESSLQLISENISERLGLHMPVIFDPFKPKGAIAMGTHPQVTKGFALQALRGLLNADYVIAAGDDYNDVTMIEQADFGIAMETGPQILLSKASYVAPSAKKEGIIPALKAAIQLRKKKI